MVAHEVAINWLLTNLLKYYQVSSVLYNKRLTHLCLILLYNLCYLYAAYIGERCHICKVVSYKKRNHRFIFVKKKWILLLIIILGHKWTLSSHFCVILSPVIIGVWLAIFTKINSVMYGKPTSHLFPNFEY